MGNIFSRKETTKITNSDRELLDLKRQRDKLKIAYKRYENDIVKEKEVAKIALKDGRKERALLLLKRKKFLETVSDRMFNSIGQVDGLIKSVEMAQMTSETIKQIKKGNEVLKALNEEYSIDEVQRIMEESREAAEQQEEISNILANNLTNQDLMDVEEEYERMIQNELPRVPADQVGLDQHPESPVLESSKEKKSPKRQKLAAS